MYQFPLAHLMGIRPWEIGLMTVEEFDLACESIDHHLDTANGRAEGES